jgi:hypothetical protein
MFIEWWERVRGFDRWPEVRATIESTRKYGPAATGGTNFATNLPVFRKDVMLERMSIAYATVDGVGHTKRIWLPACPLLLSLAPGDHFYVRYCPDNPNRLHIRERTQGNFVMILTFSILCLFFGYIAYFHS